MTVIRRFARAVLVRFSTAPVLAAGVLLLSACHESANTPVAAHAALEDIPEVVPSFPASVSGLNYTTAYIARFRIVDANGYVGGGPNIAPAKGDGKPAGGGAESCCVIVPNEWKEGMEVTVSWERDTRPDDEKDRTGDQWLTAKAKVPPYRSEHYNFWVLFLEGDRIRVEVADDTSTSISNAMPARNDPYIVQGVLDEQMNKEMNQ